MPYTPRGEDVACSITPSARVVILSLAQLYHRWYNKPVAGTADAPALDAFADHAVRCSGRRLRTVWRCRVAERAGGERGWVKLAGFKCAGRGGWRQVVPAVFQLPAGVTPNSRVRRLMS